MPLIGWVIESKRESCQLMMKNPSGSDYLLKSDARHAYTLNACYTRCPFLLSADFYPVFFFCFALLDQTKRQQGCCIAKFFFNKAKASKRERDEMTVGTPTIQRQATAAAAANS